MDPRKTADAANDNRSQVAAASGRKCPICGKPTVPDLSPFCSKRCADVDLHRWLGEGYRVPLPADPGDDLE